MLNFKRSKQKEDNTNNKPFSGELLNIEQLAKFSKILGNAHQKIGNTEKNYLRERLNYNDTILRKFNNDMLSTSNRGHITPAIEWMVDNFYLIEEHILLARHHYPKEYNNKLPCLLRGEYAGIPRVYSSVVELLSHTDSQIDMKSVLTFYQAYQEEGSELKIGELWAIPIMLQLALMEKSYEMAAKYMPTNLNQGNPMEQKPSNNLIDRVKEKQSKSSTGKKTQVKPINNIRQEVVSALAQQYSNEELMYHYDQVRNFGFSTVGNTRLTNEKNTIRAIIHDDQTLVDGQTIRLRLTEPLAAGTTIVPENSIVTGVAKIQGERLDIQITSLEHNGEIIPVEMQAYDTDGQRGIYIPGSLEMNAVKEIVANMGNSVGTSFTMTQSTGAQLTSDLTKGLIQGTSQYMNKKIKQVKVKIKSGYKMLLLPKEN